MKTKRFGKKLVINKQTISNLGDMELSGIKGGLRTLHPEGPPSCVSDSNFITCYTDCTCYTICNTDCC
jgi:hypothetical protein